MSLDLTPIRARLAAFGRPYAFLPEILREGTLLYILESIGWRKGVEQFQNRVWAHIQGGPKTPGDEAEALAALLQHAPQDLENLCIEVEELRATLQNERGLGEPPVPGWKPKGKGWHFGIPKDREVHADTFPDRKDRGIVRWNVYHYGQVAFGEAFSHRQAMRDASTARAAMVQPTGQAG